MIWRFCTAALLAALVVSSAFAQDDGAKEVKKAMDDYREAATKLSAKLRSETDRTKQQKIISDFQAEHAKQFEAIAEKYAKQPAAAEALAMAYSMNMNDPQKANKLKEKLLADFINHKALVPALVYLARSEDVMEKLEKSESKDVRGAALFYKMSQLKGRSISEENEDDVMPLMKQIQKEYSDVELRYPGGMVRGKLGELVDNELFAYNNLRIGKVAPEIEGEDISGVKFKLSDYRGKVVVIDFWGDW